MNELQTHLPELIAHRAYPSISITMPMRTEARDVLQNQIRLKNLLKRARDLVHDDLILKPLVQLLDHDGFWRQPSPGLCILHSHDGTSVHRLSWPPDELVEVSDRFHLKPILAALENKDPFYVLSLSKNQTRLLEVTHSDVRRRGAELLPESLAAVVPIESGTKQLQYHSTRANAVPIYHGQGAGERREDEEVRRFIAALEDGLEKAIPSNAIPNRASVLVLAGVAELTSAFRDASRYPNLAKGTVEGNVEALSDGALAERARPLAEEQLKEHKRDMCTHIEGLSHTELVTSQVNSIVPAAVDGRVATLFVLKNEHCWGRFDGMSRSTTLDVEQRADNEDLLDLAAVRTIEHGGRVFFADAREAMPTTDSLATALLRY